MRNAFLGIDTSNYTTSLSLVDEDGNILCNLRKLLPVKPGERGLRQSDAVFHHTVQLPELTKELQTYLTDCKIVAVGVSETPRKEKNSYMPCFLAGISYASAVSASLSCPLYRFSHQEGHIMAGLHSANAMQLADIDFIAFHVSGGTTDAVRVKKSTDGFDIEMLATSLDLHAGQAIDRIGVSMGLPFPAGKEMERLSTENKTSIPPISVRLENGNCHLSGLENLAGNLYAKTGDKALVCAYTLTYIGRTISKMTDAVAEKDTPVVYVGGVMSNQMIQNMLKKRENTYFAKPEFSCDNASGIALLARKCHSEREGKS